MVDIASLDTAARGAFSGCHNYVKNTSYLGNAYSSVLHNLDHYLIKGVAEPALRKAPEWVSDNRVVGAIQNHQGISLAVGAAVTVVSFVAFVIWLHPKGTAVNSKDSGTPPSANKTEGKGPVEEDKDNKKTTDTTLPPAKETKGRVAQGENFVWDLAEEESTGNDGEPAGTTKARTKTKADGSESSEESLATASEIEEDEEESDGTVSTSAKKSLNAFLTDAVSMSDEAGGVSGALNLGHKRESGALPSPKDTGHPDSGSSLSTTIAVADPSVSTGVGARISGEGVLSTSDGKTTHGTIGESVSSPSTPIYHRPSSYPENESLPWDINASGVGSSSGSKHKGKGFKTEDVSNTVMSSEKKKGKKKGKKGKK